MRKTYLFLIPCFVLLVNISMGKGNENIFNLSNLKHTSIPIDSNLKEKSKLEIENRRNQFSKHYLNNDGTFKMLASSSSIHYNQDNKWKDIDLEIKKNTSQKLNDYAYFNDENSFKTYYPKSPKSGFLLTRLKEGDIEETVESVYVTDELGEIVYSYPMATNIKIKNDHNQLVYQDVFPSIDLRYSQQSDGRKFDLVLKNKQCLNYLPIGSRYIVIQEKISIPANWTISETSNGIDIHAGNTWVANMPKPIMHERFSNKKQYNFDEDYAEEGSMQMIKTGNEITILTKFSVKWLLESQRNFPLYLDPVTNYYPQNVSMATGNMTSATSTKVSGNIRLGISGSISWAYFDLTSMPAASTILTANYGGYHFNGLNSSKISSIIGMESVNPISATNENINTQISTAGPIYNNSYVFGGASAQWRVGSINTNGIADLTNQISQGWTAFGFRYTSGYTGTMLQYGYNATNANDRPYLELNYSITPCSGTPIAGTAISSLASACATPFTLNLTGNTTDDGMSYQWQSSLLGTNNWSNIGTANLVSQLSIAQSVATEYRCIVTCTNSSVSDTSTIVSVAQNAMTQCYCIPLGSNSSYYINNFSTTGATTNITNNSTGFSTGGFGNYSSMTASVTQGTSLGVSIGFLTGNHSVGVWIDWNQDGDFIDADENVLTTGTSLVPSPKTGLFTVPLTALPGTTRMRVRTSSNGAATPCGASAFGEAEDYTLNVSASCSNSISAFISNSSYTVCAGTTITLNATLATPMFYQWKQSNTSGGPYTNVIGGIGATTLQYTTPALTTGSKYYILETSCSACSPCSSISNEVSITIKPTSSASFSAIACNSYIWNGTTYTTSGVYLKTFINSVGCDSIQTLNLTINYSNNISIPISACNSYIWNGTTYTNSGIYSFSYLNVHGCDSVRTLNLVVNQDNSNSSNLSACGSYLFGGTTYTVSGVYTKTFVNSSGCDSTHILNLTIKLASIPSTFNASSCDSYIWSGITYTMSGIYLRTFVNSVGCDSVRTLNLTVNFNNTLYTGRAYIPNINSNSVKVYDLSNNSLLATIPVGFQAKSVTFTPDKSKVYIGNWNTPSISVINTNSNTVTSTISLTSTNRPEGLCVSPDGTKLYAIMVGSTPSTLKVYNTSTNGLLASVNVGSNARAVAIKPDGSRVYVANSTSNTISVINTVTNTVLNTISVGNLPEGLAISPDGSKLYVALRNAGNVQVINTITNTIVATITVGTQPIGIAVSPSGTKLYVSNSISNTVSIINTATNTVSNTISTGNTPSGISFNSSGDKAYVVNYSTGTLSIINTNTETMIGSIAIGSESYCYGNFIMNHPNLPLSENVCNSYLWNGVTYTQSGVYNHTTTNSVGCDSVTTLNLNIKYSTVGASIANGSYNYTLGGITFSTSGIYTLTFTNAVGCDSIHTLNLTMTNNSGSTNISTCNAYTWNGNTFTVSGIYTSTFMNVLGFDSVHTLHLSINNNTPNIQRAYIPNYGTNTVSVINLLNNSVIATIPVGIGPYSVEVSPDGTRVYIGNLGNSINPSISVINTSTNTVIQTVQLSVSPYSIKTNMDGSKLFISSSSNSLYSMNTQNYTLTNVITQTFQLNDFIISPDGSKLYILSQEFGNNKIFIYNPTTFALLSTIFIGSVTPISITVSLDGTKLYISTYSGGPGSVVVVNTATSGIISTIPMSLGPFRLLLNANGSKLYVTNSGSNEIKIINPISNTVVKTITVGSEPNGLSFNQNGSKLYVANYGSNNVSIINTLTDSVIGTTTVGSAPRAIGNFIPNMSGVFTTVACNSFFWNDNTYTATGIYSYTTPNVLGCDSVSTLNLTIKSTSAGSSTVVACTSYTLGATTYTTSGIYTATLVNSVGCDSIHTLYLTIHGTSVSSSSIATCHNYTFGGNTFSVSGTYIVHFTNFLGCDSAHTLNLIINPTVTVTTFATGCNSYIWNGTTYTATGVYTATFSSPSCDSIHKLNLLLDRNSTQEPTAFIPNISTNSVSVVSLVSNNVLTTIPVGNSPTSVAFSPSKDKVYVVNSASSNLTIIYTAANTVAATIPLSSSPKGIVSSLDGSKLFISHGGSSGKISVISTITNSVIAILPFAYSLRTMCLSPDGSTIYTRGEISYSPIYAINTTTFSVSSITTPSFNAYNIAISPDGNKLYFICEYNTIAVYNLVSNTTAYIFLVSEGYTLSAIALSPDGSRLYVGKGGANRVAVINTNTNAVITTYFFNTSEFIHGLSVSNDGQKLYVILGSSLKTINTNNSNILNTTLLGGLPSSMSNFIGSRPAPPLNQTACDEYTWMGITYTTSGNYSFTSTNIVGCDSLSYINLTLNTSMAPVVSNLTVCGSYNFGGNTYTASGIYTDSFLLTNSCDSIHTLNLTVIPTSSSVTDISACNNYIWHGNNYITGGIYTRTYTNVVGCDSTSILKLTLTNPSPKAYIACYDSNRISVIDVASNTNIYNIPVGIRPWGVALHPDQSKVYVTNVNSNSVSVIRVSTNEVIATLSVGSSPQEICVSHNGLYVYVANHGSNTISIINTISNSVTTTLPLGFMISGMDISTDDSKLFVGNYNGPSSLVIFNTNSMTVSSTIMLSGPPTLIATNPDGVHLYVVQNNQVISVINLINGSIATTIPIGSTINGICVSPNGDKIYLTTNFPSNKVKVISTTTYSIVSEISTLSFAAEIGINSNGNKLFVMNSSSNLVRVINTSDTTSVTIPVNGYPRSKGNFISTGGGKTEYACNSYTWNGQTYTATGVYTSSFISSYSCDSIVTLNLIIRSTSSAFSSLITCNSYLWKGITYTSSGIYVRSFLNAVGCDSIHTLNLSINNANILSPKAYITSNSLNTVSVIDLKNNLMVKSIPVGTSPKQSIVNLNSSKVYVSYTSSTNISIINTTTDTIEANLPIGASVSSMVLNASGSKLYVLSTNSMRIVNTANNSISGPIPLPSGIYSEIGVSPDESKIYLISSSPSILKIISIIDYLTIANIPLGSSPGYLCQKPDGSKLYIFNKGSDNVSVINMINNSLETNIPVGMLPIAMTISPNGSKIFVSNTNEGTISVIRTDSNLVIATIPININPAGLVVSDDETKLYVALGFNGGKMRVISTVNYETLDSITVGNNLTNYGNYIASFPTIINQTACGTYNWNGLNYNASGIYTNVSSIVAGCDSVSKLNLTMSQTVTGSSNIVACDSFNWNGNTYYTSGAYIGQFLVGSCDSFHTLNLTIHNSNANSSNISACNMFVWNGTTYTNSGVYVGNFLNNNGCDSLHTLHLIIKQSNAGLSNVNSCNQYNWNGNTYTNSGSYIETFTNSAGCDSIHQLNLIINNSDSVSSYVTSCDSYFWNGNIYTLSGVYVASLINTSGCDSIHTLNLIINYNNTTTEAKAFIPNSNYNNVSVVNLLTNSLISTIPVGNYPYGVAVSPDGSKAYITNFISNSVSVINTSSSAVIATIPLANHPQGICVSPDGSKVYVTNGLNISIINSSTNQIINTIYAGSTPTFAVSVSPDGSKLFLNNESSNFVRVMFTSTNTFDPYHYLAEAQVRQIMVSPDGSRVYVANRGSNTVSAFNVTTHSLISTITVGNGPYGLAMNYDGSKLYVTNEFSNSVSVINTSTNIVTQTINVGDEPQGISTNQDGSKVYVVNHLSDNLSVINSSNDSVIATIAAGNTSFALGNFIATSSNIANFQTTCNVYSWNGSTYTSSGIYYYVSINASGCDSISTLNLTILNSSVDTSTIIACNNYTWQGATYTVSGIYTQTYLNTSGCVSSSVLNLTIFNNTNSTLNVNANNNYTWNENGVTYTSSGVYIYTYLNSSGCVHTSILNLVINFTAINSVNAFQDQSVSCNGLNDGSCQTIVLPNGNYSYQLDGGIQTNSSGFFNGLIPGIHTVCVSDGQNSYCDTVFISEPDLLLIQFVVDSTVSCNGNDGQLSLNISGGTATLQNYLTWWVNGNGDTLNNVLTNNFATSIGNLVTDTYSVLIEDDHGCFATNTINLIADSPLAVTNSFAPILCHGGTTSITPSITGGSGIFSITVNNQAFQPNYSAGTYTMSVSDSRGCIVSEIITISEPTSLNTFDSIISCDSYTWYLNGSTYTTSGIYTTSTMNSFGCTGISTLYLDINHSSLSQNNIIANVSYTWPINNATYTNSGIYLATFLSSSGCDSNYTLNLTITGVTLNAKVFLTGPYNPFTGLMHDSLRVLNLIPLTEPYSFSPYNKPQIGGIGGETIISSILSISGNDAIVDWIYIELRSASDSAAVIATKRALLQRDGDIVSHVDGISPLTFEDVPQGNYFIGIKHRNHLGIMSSTSYPLNYSTTSIDFTSSIAVYTLNSIPYNAPRKITGGVYSLWGGDANNNKNVKYTGISNDKNAVLDALGNNTPNNIMTGYRIEDVNMDGKVKFNNLENDKNFILMQIGVNSPNIILSQHGLN